MADIAASNWNSTDSSNTDAAPDGFPEGMAPSGVNNGLRAHQGAIKRWYKWSTPATTAGTSTAFTLAYDVAPGALVDGMTHLVQFNAANGDAPTLNINSLGATPIYYYSAGAWRAVPAALWDADTIYRLAYHSSSGTYRILNRPDTTGDWVLTGRSTARGGTLLAYGQAISRTAYAGLFAAYSTTYGVGDGSTTFNLPDLRGRVAAGKDDMGGAAASRLTGGAVLGAALGTQSSTTGSATGSTSNANAASGGDFTAAQSNTAMTVTSSTVQPTLIGNYAVCL
jgi:microcystin-dependent protein